MALLRCTQNTVYESVESLDTLNDYEQFYLYFKTQPINLSENLTSLN